MHAKRIDVGTQNLANNSLPNLVITICHQICAPFVKLHSRTKGYRFSAEIVPSSQVKMLVKLTTFFYSLFSATGRRMNTVINLYIGNLALADVIIAIFCIPFQFQAALLHRWDLPSFLCKLCPFVQVRVWINDVTQVFLS